VHLRPVLYSILPITATESLDCPSNQVKGKIHETILPLYSLTLLPDDLLLCISQELQQS
jgi:hypothetical protein